MCQQENIFKTHEKLNCETALITSPAKAIPVFCKTRTIQADFEVWQPLPNNQWIFILSKPTRITISCDSSPIEDADLESTGVLQLRENCKGYTSTSVLQASRSYTPLHINVVPDINILQDDCCIRKPTNMSLDVIKLQPIRLANINLDELNYAHHKLQQFDEVLQHHLNQPFKPQVYHWYSILFSVLGSMFGLLVTYYVLIKCGLLKIVWTVLCCQRKPTSPCTGCCPKIFNTNITGVPVTQAQLSRILEEEARHSEPRDSSTAQASIPLVLQPTPRRSISREPSIDFN